MKETAMVNSIPRALSVAGSDSGAGAGIQADLKTFTAFGVYGMTAITAITAQNTLGVQAVWNMPPEVVAAQMDAVLSDMGADALKTGMLATPEIVEVVADRIRFHRLGAVVVDPVMQSKGGAALLEVRARRVLAEVLLPLAAVVTPNLDEASCLAGFDVKDLASMRDAAWAIHDLGSQNVVVKGGHLEGRPVDLLFDGHDFFEFSGIRRDAVHTHGTGCTFASALAACLALKMDLRQAVKAAKDYVDQAIRNGLALGKGQGPVGCGLPKS